MFNDLHRDFELKYNNLRYDVSDGNCYSSGTTIYDMTQRQSYVNGTLVNSPTISSGIIGFDGSTNFIKMPRTNVSANIYI